MLTSPFFSGCASPQTYTFTATLGQYTADSQTSTKVILIEFDVKLDGNSIATDHTICDAENPCDGDPSEVIYRTLTISDVLVTSQDPVLEISFTTNAAIEGNNNPAALLDNVILAPAAVAG